MRSKFEETIAKQIKELGGEYEYEGSTYLYEKKVRSAQCGDCNSSDVYQTHRYTPDFEVWGKRVQEDGTLAFFIETKGVFSPSDRAKMLLIKEQHPKVDIRLVFQRDNKIPIRGPKKKKPTSYAEWAEFHGFKYSVGRVPAEWLT